MSEQQPEVYRFDEDVGMVPGLSLSAIKERLEISLRYTECHQRESAFYLHEVRSRRLHKSVGFHRFLQWAEVRLGLARQRAGELARMGGLFEELGALDEAFRDQVIPWSKALAMAPILTEGNVVPWIEEARKWDCKELQRRVKLHEKGEFPKPDSELKGTTTTRFRVQVDLDADGLALLTQVQNKQSAETGRSLSVTETIQNALGFARQLELKGEVEGWTFVPSSRYVIHLYPPPRGHRPDGDPEGGLPIDREGDASDEAKRLAEAMEDMDSPLRVQTNEGLFPLDQPGSPASRNRSKIARHDALIVGNGDKKLAQKTPTALRARVLARDENRCRCCGAPYDLHVHHKKARAQYGPTQQSNLTGVCMYCHGMIHEGLIRVVGENAGDAVFTDAEGHPLHGPGETIDPKKLVRMVRQARREKGKAREPLVTTSAIFELPPEVDATWWKQNAERITYRKGGVLGYDPTAPLVAVQDEARNDLEPDAEAFDGLVGHDALIPRLERQVAVAAARGEAFPPTLFTGPAGTGKTTLAEALARRLGLHLESTSGPRLSDMTTLVTKLVSLRDGDVLFLDEIHAMPRQLLEALYEAIDKGSLVLTFREGALQRSVRVTLARFTLIAATTHPSALPQPLRSRMEVKERLSRYRPEDLGTMAAGVAAEDGARIAEDAALVLGTLARGIPRRARQLGRLAGGYAVTGPRPFLDLGLVWAMLEEAGYDRRGLTEEDRGALEALRDNLGRDGKPGAPMGIARLADSAEVEIETLKKEIEPELLRQGLISVGRGGRQITAEGRRHLMRPGGSSPGPEGHPPEFKPSAADRTSGQSWYDAVKTYIASGRTAQA